ncbi:TIGR02444 family protein [Rhizobium puerariae]|uniref:TIGR02444 family protein n=1 Tax=Rhizobium puerariae TaxID=1585791 RepID=A0ABV6AGQ5_9HYPH
MTAGDRQGLWGFSLRLYGLPGVGDACLVLQDESDVDVPVFLFAAWLSKNSVALRETDLARIDGLVASWREEVVKPLRAVRRRLRSGLPPAPATETGRLRNGVKGVELDAERIELALLEAEGLALAGTGDRRDDAGANLTLVLRYFRGSAPDAKASLALRTVEAALAGP